MGRTRGGDLSVFCLLSSRLPPTHPFVTYSSTHSHTHTTGRGGGGGGAVCPLTGRHSRLQCLLHLLMANAIPLRVPNDTASFLPSLSMYLPVPMRLLPDAASSLSGTCHFCRCACRSLLSPCSPPRTRIHTTTALHFLHTPPPAYPHLYHATCHALTHSRRVVRAATPTRMRRLLHCALPSCSGRKKGSEEGAAVVLHFAVVVREATPLGRTPGPHPSLAPLHLIVAFIHAFSFCIISSAIIHLSWFFFMQFVLDLTLLATNIYTCHPLLGGLYAMLSFAL